MDWSTKFRGVTFQASSVATKVMKALLTGLHLEIEPSNPRRSVPTWHVFYRGVRILALDVNQGGILCRMLKMDHWSENIESLPGLRWEQWNRGRVANVSLDSGQTARKLRPQLERHLAILDSVLDGKQTDLSMPRLDRKHLREQYFESEVAENLKYIEKGLKLVRRQLVTASGRLDLLCKDVNGAPVVLELKLSADDESAIEQIGRYVDIIKSETGMNTRGIIVVKEPAGIAGLRKAISRKDISVSAWAVPPTLSR